jgi:type I restriction enzyme S subunit
MMREDWIEVELGELTENPKNDIVDGPFGSNLKSDEYVDSGIPVFKIQNIKANRFVDKNIHYVTPQKSEELKRHTFKKGDLIITKLGDPLGLCCKVPEKYEFGVIVADLIRFRPSDKIVFDKYLIYGINSILIQQQFKEITKGTTRPRVNLTIVRSLKFPLAPLPEQRAIAAKIEQLFSELDNGIANLKTAKSKLEIYRQAILKQAFEGKLTKEWRKKQNNLPTSEELLSNIKQEQEWFYEKQLIEFQIAISEWEKNGKLGDRPTKPTKRKQLPDIVDDELDSLTKLADGMAWIRLGDIVWSVKDGPHYSPKYSEKGIPFISGGNIRPNGINFSNAKFISQELHLELSKRCKPELNDVLYTKGGTTGIARVNTYDFDFNVWVHVAVLKPLSSIYPFYLQYVLNSNHCYKQSQKYTHGVGNQDLGLTRMVLITLPICSLQEQIQIVQEIETRLSVCDKLNESIDQSLEKAQVLRQSILKKAFEGKLLSQDELQNCRQQTDWEPAAKLLERIKNKKNK